MINKTELITYLDEFLEINAHDDYSWNGLQIDSSKSEIYKLSFAVDACMGSIKASADSDSQMLITHHGLFWRGASPNLVGHNYKRIVTALDADLAVYSAHLPLDSHKQVGNNAQIIAAIDAEIVSDFAKDGSGKAIGYFAQLKKPENREELLAKLDDFLGTDSHKLNFGSAVIKRVAVLSGASSTSHIYEAHRGGADLLVTGEQKEIYQTAKDMGLNVVFAGHYYSETVGLKALAKQLQSRYQLETEFIDLPTGL
jgi:dinuclear metal center YbgI/SA1388 family protein